MKDASGIFFEPGKWSEFKKYNSSVVYKINNIYELVFAVDQFVFFKDDTKDSKTGIIDIPHLGEIKKSLLIAFLEKNPDIAEKEGIIFQKREIKEKLDLFGYKDSTNSNLLSRSVVVKGVGMPVFGFTSFIKFHLLNEEQFQILTDLARKNEIQYIYNFLIKLLYLQ